MNTSNNTKKLLKMALIIATYVAVTAVIAPFAFGNIQFRLSEVMVLLAFIDPLYIPALFSTKSYGNSRYDIWKLS